MPGAVTEIATLHASFREQVQIQVIQRSFLRVPDVATTLDLAGAASGNQNGQVVVRVAVPIGGSTAVNNDRVVEEVAVTVGRRSELLEEVREVLYEERINLRDVVDLLGIALVRSN